VKGEIENVSLCKVLLIHVVEVMLHRANLLVVYGESRYGLLSMKSC